MENLKQNLQLLESDGTYYSANVPKPLKRSKLKHFSVIYITETICSKFHDNELIEHIRGLCSTMGIRLFDICRRGVCCLYEKVMGTMHEKIDKDAAINNYLPIIHDYEGNSPHYTDCQVTNSLILDCGDSIDETLCSVFKAACEMLELYPQLHTQSIKASIINCTDADLSHVVRNDGSFSQIKCTKCSDYRLNLHLMGEAQDMNNRDYKIYFPHYVRGMKITATVCNYGTSTQFDNLCSILSRYVRLSFRNLPNYKGCIIKDESLGNLHRMIIYFDFSEFLKMDYTLTFRYDGYNSGRIEGDVPIDKRFFSTVMLEMDDFPDYKHKSFYEDMIKLNPTTKVSKM